jgi:hypothetical protein
MAPLIDNQHPEIALPDKFLRQNGPCKSGADDEQSLHKSSIFREPLVMVLLWSRPVAGQEIPFFPVSRPAHTMFHGLI